MIPPACKQVRGIVVAQHNMEEISILENLKFRAALAELNFAEVWVAPFFDHTFRFNQGAGETLEDMLNRLADESGYAELKYVPLAPIGHSAAASWPYYFAAWKPERALCALSVSGQWPYFRHPDFAPDIWGARNIDFVPSLESMGEYEGCKDSFSREGLKQRVAHPKMPLSMLACPGEGHFASTEGKAEFPAFYLRKTVQHRVPENWDGKSAPLLIPIDPTKIGWLAEKWRRDQAPTVAAAPVGQYQGDPKEAFWFSTKSTPKQLEKYQAAFRGLKPQLVGCAGRQVGGAEGKSSAGGPQISAAVGWRDLPIDWWFYDTVPAVSSRLANWTLPADKQPARPCAQRRHLHRPNLRAGCKTLQRIRLRSVCRRRRCNTQTRAITRLFSLQRIPATRSSNPPCNRHTCSCRARNRSGAPQTISFRHFRPAGGHEITETGCSRNFRFAGEVSRSRRSGGNLR